jgi:dephospho-CoA kinase
VSSKWPDKYVIGLTGNIATGKSVVRKMLEHLGAYGIDADALAHRAIAKGAPGYQPVVDTFGKWILAPNGEIDRNKLGRLVFADPDALAKLESIVHPLVRQAIDLMVKRVPQKVIVIEAIKLLEGELKNVVDTVWVTYASPDVQLKRLMEKRGMSEADARQRIAAQGNPQEKTIRANVVIRNEGDFAETWKQVQAAWQQIQPDENDTGPVMLKQGASADELSVARGRPKQSQAIADFINRASKGQRKLTAGNIMEAFGEKAFLLLLSGDEIKGLAAWQVENLVARTTDFYLDADVNPTSAIQVLLPEIEKASRDLQCEASLLFLSPDFNAYKDLFARLGYEPRTIESLSIQAWEEAARESQPPGTVLYFKQLRQDRVLRPI